MIERQKHLGIEQEEESDASSEDSNGDMINEEFYGKFITSLAKIKTRQSEIYEEENELFKESDLNINKEGVI